MNILSLVWFCSNVRHPTPGPLWKKFLNPRMKLNINVCSWISLSNSSEQKPIHYLYLLSAKRAPLFFYLFHRIFKLQSQNITNHYLTSPRTKHFSKLLLIALLFLTLRASKTQICIRPFRVIRQFSSTRFVHDMGYLVKDVVEEVKEHVRNKQYM